MAPGGNFGGLERLEDRTLSLRDFVTSCGLVLSLLCGLFPSPLPACALAPSPPCLSLRVALFLLAASVKSATPRKESIYFPVLHLDRPDRTGPCRRRVFRENLRLFVGARALHALFFLHTARRTHCSSAAAAGLKSGRDLTPFTTETRSRVLFFENSATCVSF